MTTTIGYMQRDSPAAKAGLRPGDKILEVDGEPVSRFTGMNNSVVWNVVRSEGETIPIKVERDGAVLDFNVAPYKAETSGWRRKSVRQIMIAPAQTRDHRQGACQIRRRRRPACCMATSSAGSMARRFIIRSRSVITSRRIPISRSRSQVLRDGKLLEPTAAADAWSPPMKRRSRALGIRWDADGRMSVAHPGPVEQVYKSVTSTLNTIGAVASPKSDIKLQHMSGPVGIGRIYYLLFQTERGWQLALWFSVILNVNLAILNMLPIPVLDGGHIVLAIIESIRRKPVTSASSRSCRPPAPS